MVTGTETACTVGEEIRCKAHCVFEVMTAEIAQSLPLRYASRTRILLERRARRRVGTRRWLEAVSLALAMFSFAVYYYRIGAGGIVLPQTYLSARETGGAGLPFVGETAVLLCLVVFLLLRGPDPILRGGLDSIGLILLITTAYAFLLTSLDPYGVTAASPKGTLRTALTLPLIAYVLGSNVRDRRDLKLARVCFLVGASMQALAMVSPSLFPPNLIWGIHQTAYLEHPFSGELVLSEFGRAVGFYQRSSHAASYILLAICLGFPSLCRSRTWAGRIALVATLGLFCLALMRSLQRVQVVGLLVIAALSLLGFPRGAYIQHRKRILFLIAAAGILLLYPFVISRFLPGPTDWAEEGRLAVWEKYFNWFQDFPLVLLHGAGMGVTAFTTSREVFHIGHGHNQFLSYVGYIGVPMTLLFGSAIVLAAIRIARTVRIRRKNAEDAIWNHCAFLLMVSLVIQSLTETPFLRGPFVIPFFFFLGFARAGAPQTSRSRANRRVKMYQSIANYQRGRDIDRKGQHPSRDDRESL